jgi:hypothetical protein
MAACGALAEEPHGGSSRSEAEASPDHYEGQMTLPASS